MRKKVVMVQPKLGLSGRFVQHAPLGLLYAASSLVKEGADVVIVDNRLYPRSWESELKKHLDKETLIVGVSVISGEPIRNAIEISRFVKENDPAIKVVWGGPHATYYSENILREESCDYVVSGYGSRPLAELCRSLAAGEPDPAAIAGLSYRGEGGAVHSVPYICDFEWIDFRDIPYHLIPDYTVYGQLDHDDIFFSLYSAMGCPYKCAFCSSPAFYREFPKKWVKIDARDVVDHIEHVVKTYGATYIYFIDDDSFVSLEHVEEIIDEINRRGIDVKLGFRGARINEIKRMSDAFLEKLAGAGTTIMHIGAESGSDRILELMNKNFTVDDIVSCNRKLARHGAITAAYNFIVGLPTETSKELHATGRLILRLIEENAACIVFPLNRFRPLPKTELYEFVQKRWEYTPPVTLEEWINFENEGDYSVPWMTARQKSLCDMMFLASYFVDNKIEKTTSGKEVFYRLVKIAGWIYRPVAIFRLRHGFPRFLAEFAIYRLMVKILK